MSEFFFPVKLGKHFSVCCAGVKIYSNSFNKPSPLTLFSAQRMIYHTVKKRGLKNKFSSKNIEIAIRLLLPPSNLNGIKKFKIFYITGINGLIERIVQSPWFAI